MQSRLRVAVVGAGIGGLAVAAALRRNGIDVTIYEQATAFARVGAGIQVSPNAVRVLRGLDIEERIRARAFQPRHWKNRASDTGETRFDFILGKEAEERYGAPYLLMHRADLHASLESLVPKDIVQLGRRVQSFEETPRGVTMRFADGSIAEADMVIGADGVHSVVREHLFGLERPRFSGRVAYRTVFPAALLGDLQLDDNTKWWGPDRHIVIYYVNGNRDELYFVTSVPEQDWTSESWSKVGDINSLRIAFSEFHPDVRRVLDACPKVHKWAIMQRDPLPLWSSPRIVLLGDSCHPMTPYMAQGAAMAMEDAVVLARCLDGADQNELENRFRRYELTRKDRTSRVQIGSHENRFMSGQTNPDWLYAYDAWTTPLASAPGAAGASG
jgi:6-hydroxynicotinate 3-monooxygenase